MVNDATVDVRLPDVLAGKQLIDEWLHVGTTQR